MKTAIFWLATFFIFGTANSMIAQKEATIRNGVTMLFDLAPRDPRSLMQGDYMTLRYRLAQDAHSHLGKRGKMVLKLDENRVAQFVRQYEGEPLAEGEHLLKFVRRGSQIRFGSDAFFFQEGHGQYYEPARYGEMKVAPTGECVLVGLRNQDFSECGPPS